MNRILTKSHFIKISVFIQPHYTLCRGGEIRLSGYKAHLWYTAPAKLSYQKIYVPSKWLLNFDKYGYERHVDIK